MLPIFGYQEILIEYHHPLKVFFLLFDSSGVNIIPDFISVAETGWILSKATEKNSNITALFLLDLFLTTLIWVIAHCVAILYATFILPGDPASLSIESILNMYSMHGAGDNWLSYILTTYTTSGIWFGFVLSVLLVAAAKRMSTWVLVILESKWVRELPLLFIVGVPCLLAWLVLLVLRIFS